MKLFISHASQDVALVGCVVELVRQALSLTPSEIRCTSLPGYDLRAGDTFIDLLRDEAVSADAFVAVISPASLRSLWTSFELGARWGTQRPLVQLHVPGTAMPSHPLQTEHHLVTTDAGLRALVNRLAEDLGVAPTFSSAVEAAISSTLEVPAYPHAYQDVALGVMAFVVNEHGEFALSAHDRYKQMLPPGGRLFEGVRPHAVARELAALQLTLDPESLQRFPPAPVDEGGTTYLVSPPYQVQVERSVQGAEHAAANEHYSFVYAFTVRGRPVLLGERDYTVRHSPRWYRLPRSDDQAIVDAEGLEPPYPVTRSTLASMRRLAASLPR